MSVHGALARDLAAILVDGSDPLLQVQTRLKRARNLPRAKSQKPTSQSRPSYANQYTRPCQVLRVQ